MAPRIDFHTHVLPREAERFDAPSPGWPRLVLDDPCSGHLVRNGIPFRTIDERSWSAQRRIADMDTVEIDMQVLSPLPPTFAYDFPAAMTGSFARMQNDAIATLVRARPDRFAGLGGVPLQDPDAACAELERVMTELRLSGIEIGTNAAGRELVDPVYDALWRACDAHAAIVFVHPESAPGFARLRAPQLAFAAGYPAETGTALASLLAHAVPSRFPRIRFVVAHGGGALPWLLPRLDAVWDAYSSVRAAQPVRPSEAARALSYDTLTYDAENLRVLAERVGTGRLVVGSDYPFLLQENPPGATVLACAAFDDAQRAGIRGGNAKRLLAR